jgi:cytoskeleton protein RodZ
MAETKAQSEESGFNEMPVGEILRRTRQHYNQSIEDIEYALRIRASQIEAIESGDLKALPGKVYAVGFVRSYAEFLGLDGDKIVKLFKAQAVGQEPETELYFPAPASEGQLPPWWITLTCIFAAIAILAFWFGESRQQREIVETIPPVPSTMQAEEPVASPAPLSTSAPAAVSALPAPEIEAENEAKQEEEIIKEKPAKGIILNIRENSWVEIRDKQGKAMLSRVLKAGDQYYVPDRPDLTISIGNAGGVEIEVDGQPLRKLGESGKVLRRLSLDAQYLKENFALEDRQ